MKLKINGEIKTTESALIVNGNSIKITSERDPSNINWGELDVGEDKFSLYTPCGDCEHVAAIVAAYLAGMLSSQQVNKNMIVSYLPSHSHCNKRKTNMVAVMFDTKKENWVIDVDEAENIAKAILNPGIDGTEYDPLVAYRINNKMMPDEDEITGLILNKSQIWCDRANTYLASLGPKNDISGRLITIMKKVIGVIPNKKSKKDDKDITKTKIKPKIKTKTKTQTQTETKTQTQIKKIKNTNKKKTIGGMVKSEGDSSDEESDILKNIEELYSTPYYDVNNNKLSVDDINEIVSECMVNLYYNIDIVDNDNDYLNNLLIDFDNVIASDTSKISADDASVLFSPQAKSDQAATDGEPIFSSKISADDASGVVRPQAKRYQAATDGEPIFSSKISADDASVLFRPQAKRYPANPDKEDGSNPMDDSFSSNPEDYTSSSSSHLSSDDIKGDDSSGSDTGSPNNDNGVLRLVISPEPDTDVQSNPVIDFQSISSSVVPPRRNKSPRTNRVSTPGSTPSSTGSTPELSTMTLTGEPIHLGSLPRGSLIISPRGRSGSASKSPSSFYSIRSSPSIRSTSESPYQHPGGRPGGKKTRKNKTKKQNKTRKQRKNKQTKRISYVKNKQTRKNKKKNKKNKKSNSKKAT